MGTKKFGTAAGLWVLGRPEVGKGLGKNMKPGLGFRGLGFRVLG